MAAWMLGKRQRPVPESKSRTRRKCLALASGLALAAHLGCSGARQGTPMPPQTLAPPPENPETTATVPAPTPLPAAEPGPDSPDPELDPSVTRIPAPSTVPPAGAAQSANLVHLGSSEPGDAEASQSLVAAAMEERLRRRDAASARVVVTDKNLDSLAARGTLTESDDPPASTPARGAAGRTADDPRDERWWRREVRGLREEWAQAAREVEQLRSEADRLRTRFYSEDDPFVRDGQIKPGWDRALDRLGEARERVEEMKDRLEKFLEEGRRAGAMPGWLREGIDLEPQPHDGDRTRSPAPAEPVEAPENG